MAKEYRTKRCDEQARLKGMGEPDDVTLIYKTLAEAQKKPGPEITEPKPLKGYVGPDGNPNPGLSDFLGR